MMHHIWLIAAVGSIVGVASVSFALLRHRVARAAVVADVREPRSLVEMLTTPAAVADAALRAASFERSAALRANTRAERYEALAAAEKAGRTGATVHDIGERNAS